MVIVSRIGGLTIATLLLLSGVAGAQAGGPECLDWEQAASDGPSPRSGLAMAYDQARGVTVLFGGTGDSGLLDDTWEWDGHTWTPRGRGGDSPPAREGHAMAFDQASGKVLLFGGVDVETELDDTWLWDGYAGAWVQVAEGDPGPRSHSAMACDTACQQLLLFGGTEDGVLFNDTWAWNGESWTRVNTPSAPPARRDHAMAYCPIDGTVVMFGGHDEYSPLGDTWIWSGGSWLEGPSGPPARHLHAMASDALGGVVLFGGGTPNQGPLDDCWHYDGEQWLPGSTGPPGRVALAMAFDSDRYATVLFGGQGVRSLGDTWELDEAEPEVLVPPADATACVGGSTMFAVQATGIGTLSYQWRKDGVPLVDGAHISGATTHVLSVYPVAAAYQGHYDVIVSDDCGEVVSEAAALSVLAKTQISEHPADAVAIEGGGVSFPVEAVGADLTYQWYQDGAPLADGPRVSGSGTSLLAIDPVELPDAGSYHVEIGGHCGTLLSNVAILAVLPDRDRDGIPDDSDNCPDVPNVRQFDRDDDLVGDACDACPDDPDKIKLGACGCGTPDDDTDGDGVPDCADNCPANANADQADADDDGIGDVCDDDQAGREQPQPADSAFIRGLIDLITAADQPTDDSEYAMDVIDQALSSIDQPEQGGEQENQDGEQTESDDQSARPDVLTGICPAASTTLLALTLLGLSRGRRGLGGR